MRSTATRGFFALRKRPPKGFSSIKVVAPQNSFLRDFKAENAAAQKALEGRLVRAQKEQEERLVRAQKEQEGGLERARADWKVDLRAMESRISANLKANLDELIRSYNLNIAGLVLAFAYFTGLLAFSTPPSS